MKTDAMRESKVIRLLSNFPPGDLSEFRDFVSSPIFNKDPMPLKFLDLLLPVLPDAPSAESVQSTLFPERKDEDNHGNPSKRLDKLKHQMVQLILSYIDFRARYRPEDRHFHALARAEEWREREEEKAHRKEIESLEQALADPGALDSLSGWHTFRLAGHLATHAPHYDRRTRFQRLEQAWHSLDSLQQIQKLRYLCVLVNQVRITGSEPPPWLQTQLSEADSLVEPGNPLSRTYADCLAMQMDPFSEARYDVFMGSLEKIAPKLAPEEARDLYQYAINFQIRRFNRRQDEAAAQTIRDLYQSLLVQGILLENGSMSAWNYKNIVSLMARMGALDWLDQFMDSQEPLLRFDYGDNAANFCRGLVAFYRRDFAESARRMELVLVNFRNVFWGLEARALLLQSHYERARHEELETVYHSSRMYVGRTAGAEVSPEHQAGYRNFNRFLYKLSGIVTGDQDRLKARLTKLGQAISETDFLPNKAWLLEKVEAALGN